MTLCPPRTGPSSAAVTPADLPPPSQRVVLLVDDDDLVRRALARGLKREFAVLEVSSYHGALEVLDQEAVDALVTDYELGDGLDGVALLGETRRRWPHVRRVLVTGSTTPPKKVAGSPWEAMFLKPFSAKDLVDFLSA